MPVFVIPYTSPVNYTYNASKIEVSGGYAKLREDLTAFTPIAGPAAFGRWHLNESSGIVAPDSSGQGNNGTLVNMSDSDWVTGHINNALSFTSGKYVSFGTTVGNWERTNPFSIEFWFKTTYGTSQIIISKQSSSAPTYPGWNVTITSNGYIQLELIYQWNLNRRILVEDPDGFYNNGVWHHCIWTYNGTSLASGITLQIDGVDKTSGLTTYYNNLIGSILNGAISQLGGRDGTGTSNCVLDEVRFYNRVLNSAEKTFLWNFGAGREDWRRFNDIPTIYKTSGDSDPENIEWIGFCECVGPNHDGNVGYQLSNDGIDWYYFNGSTWVIAGGSLYNAVDTVNSNINTFPLDGGTIYVKAFLISNGLQIIELDTNQVTYSTNQAPVVSAGPDIENVLDHTQRKPFYMASFYDPDGTVEKAYYKVDGQVDVWTEIEKNGWGTLLEAVREFIYLFDVIGDNIVRLMVEDNEAGTSEDYVTVNVIKITVTFYVRDLDSGSHVNSIEFLPGDGSPLQLVNSPFTWQYEWSAINRLANLVASGYVSLFQVPITTTVHTETLYMVQSIFYTGKAEVQWNFDDKELIVNTWLEVQGRLITDLDSVSITIETYDASGTITPLDEKNTDVFNSRGVAEIVFTSTDLGGELVEYELYVAYGVTKYKGIEYQFIHPFVLKGTEGTIATLSNQTTIKSNQTTMLANQSTMLGNQSVMDDSLDELLVLGKGRWKIDPVTSKLTKYDADGVTPLVVFDLKDALGNPNVKLVYERIPE